MDQPMTCPKCASAMQRGFIPEFSHRSDVSFWVEGEPKESFWAVGVKIDPDKIISIVTYRCVGCGFLESYAKR